MARQFQRSSFEYLERDSVLVSGTPFTMAGWFNSAGNTVDQCLMSLPDKDVEDNYFSIHAQGNIGGDPIDFRANDGGGVSVARTTTGFNINTWHHAAAVSVSSTDRRAFIDGGSKNTVTASVVPSGIDNVTLARFGVLSPAKYFDGRLAEWAVWNVALSDAEIALLAKGFSPLFIQPHNLVAYWPLIRDDDNDWIGGFDLTPTNTPSIFTHPPLVVYPTIPTYSFSQQTQSLSPTGIGSAEAFGSPNISLRTLGVTGIASAEVFGSPSIIKRQGVIVIIPDQKPILVTPGFSDYKVRLKDQAGVLVAEFDSWRSLSFSHIINSPGACRLEIDATDSRAALFELDGQIEVWRRNLDVGLDWYIEWEGFHRTQNDLVQQNDNKSFVSYALGYLTLLNRRHIMYFAGTVQTNKSGAGETVIKEFVLQNAGADALSANGRLGGINANIAGLTIEADQGNGATWNGARAYKNLLTVAAEIAVETGVDIELVSIGTVTYEFRVLNAQRTDRSITGLDNAGLNAAGNAPVIFALGFGNMALPLFSINRSTEANAVYALGQGEASNRAIVLRQDLNAIADSPINRIEIIRNATQQSDTDGLNSVGDGALVENQKKETLRFNGLQIEGTFYGKDYFWGDLITARYRTSEFNKKIVDVRITVSNTQGGETITLEFADIP